MNRDRDFFEPPKNERKVLSFKSVIVMTIEDNGREPTLDDVKLALVRKGLRFSTPANADTPIVISLSED